MVHLTQAAQEVVQVQVGVHTGQVICGTCGSERLLEYSIMGPGLHGAKLVHDACAMYHVPLLASQHTVSLTADALHTRIVDCVLEPPCDSLLTQVPQLKIELVQLLRPKKSKVPNAEVDCYELYSQGFQCYRANNFQSAQSLFEKAAATLKDGPSQVMARRCARFGINPHAQGPTLMQLLPTYSGEAVIIAP